MLRYMGATASEFAFTNAGEMTQSGAGSTPIRPSCASASQTVREARAATINPLVARLECFGPLTDEAIFELQRQTRNSQARSAGEPLFQENSPCEHVCVLIDGIACRYRMLSGGRRQILGYILPGDLCDVEFASVGAADHNVSMLTHGLVVKIAAAKLIEVLAAFPAIKRAVEMAGLIDKSILRQWLLNIAQTSASERLSHFLCEYLTRMEQIGYLNADGSVPFAINQIALADTLGLSAVHINRTLQALRAANMIILRKRHLRVLGRERLAAMGSFDPGYLQIRKNIH